MDETPKPITDVALIFEGGGMRASYTSAVVKKLVELGIDFPLVAGVSAGASNSVNYVSKDGERAKRSFVDFAEDPEFGNWLTFLQGKGYFNSKHIYEETAAPDQILPFNFEAFSANPAELRIGAFDAESGGEMVWSKKAGDMATLSDLMPRVRASSTMPFLMPMVDLDGRKYVDGALGPNGGIALDFAQSAGYEKFFVVLTRPRSYVKEPNKAERFFRWHFRRYPAVAQALATRHSHYNTTREELSDLESSGQAFVFYPDDMKVSNSTSKVAELQESFDAGWAQAQRDYPKWLEFLGV
ncbi:MAG: patatin family protein [Propionibacteriaceae bacterium]|nr:patatin family protein [Propionibacteriaceae bacterium]